MKRGYFIVLEGIDGSGSTTQSKMLCEYLESRSRRCHLTAEPSLGPIGVLIREFLKKEEKKPDLFWHLLALSFATDRLYHYEFEILPKLNEGIDVVSDRYVLSSLVYQGADLPLEWVKDINRYAPLADLTILIDTPEEIAKERRKMRGAAEEVFEKSELQKKLHEQYLKLAFTSQAYIVEGSGKADQVFEAVKQTVQAKLGI